MGTRKQLKIDLIQPRHNYAPKDGPGHIYLPTALLTAAARFEEAGIETKLHDENFRDYSPLTSSHIGINLIGPPYVPVAIRILRRFLSEPDRTCLIGGAGANGFTQSQFQKLFMPISPLFGPKVFFGNNDASVAAAFGQTPLSLRFNPATKVSLIPVYEKIPDHQMREYLNREFCLYVSQGCKFACSFCAAKRTFRDPTTGKLTKVTEEYRDLEIIGKDLTYLVSRAKKLGLTKLSFYMSNLDAFQTPDLVFRFGELVSDIKRSNPGFEIGFRALATVDSYFEIRNSHRKSLEKLVEVGFQSVGFGVDGMTPQVWRFIKKSTNTQDKCLESIRSAKEDFGITPEVLMVLGHEGVDTYETLKLAYEFTLDMVDKYGAKPRPHVSKSFVPGNDGWYASENAAAVMSLICSPDSFQTLDFTALPSTITHPTPLLRELTADFFLKICSIPGNITKYVKPITPDLKDWEVQNVKIFNEGRYDI